MEVNNSPHNQSIQANSRAPISASVDPRLNRPCPPLKTSSLSHRAQISQPSSPIASPLPTQESTRHGLSKDGGAPVPQIQSESGPKTDAPESNDLVSKLIELMDARCLRMYQMQEKAEIEKQDASNRRDLEEAKKREAPSPMVAFLQADASANQNKLSRINHELARQHSLSTEVAQQAAVLFQQGTRLDAGRAAGLTNIAPRAAQNSASLEKDVEMIKRTILIKKEEDLPQKPIDLFKVCNTVESQSKAHTGFRKSINALEEWKSTVEHELKNHQNSTNDSSGLVVDQLTGQVCNVNKKISDLEDRLKTIDLALEKHQNITNELLIEQRSIKDNLSSQKSEFESKVTSQGQTFSQTLVQKFNDVSQMVDGIKNSHSQQSSTSESYVELRDQVLKLGTGLGGMEEKWEDLRRRVPHLAEASKEVEKHVKSYDGLAISLRSLENRWNNINTDQMVRKMSYAMHELYPSTQQLIEQVNSLKTAFNQDIQGIKADSNTQTDKVVRMQSQLDQLHATLVTQKTKCTDNAPASDNNHETSKLKSNEFEAQLQDLKSQFEATKNAIDELRKQPPIENPPSESSPSALTATQAQSYIDQMKAIFEQAELEMSKRLADLKPILAFLSEELSNSQSIGSRQSLPTEADTDISHQSRTAPIGTETPSQASVGRHSHSLSMDTTRQSLLGVQHDSDPEEQHNGNCPPISSSKNGFPSKRPREEFSDDDSPSSVAPTTTTTSNSPATSNPDIRAKKKAKKKNKKNRQSHLGTSGV